jgi:anthraniloyl-CoA monooxygenase
VGRPHLYDPYWTLHAAADQGFGGPHPWIDSYKPGSRRPNDGSRDASKAGPRSFGPMPARPAPRWRPRRLTEAS